MPGRGWRQSQLIKRDQLAKSDRLLSAAVHRLHPPLMIKKCIDRDPAQPGIEARLAAEAAEGLVSLQPNLLRQVFRLVRIAGVMQRQRIYAPLVRASQRTECFMISFLRALDQLVFLNHRLSSSRSDFLRSDF